MAKKQNRKEPTQPFTAPFNFVPLSDFVYFPEWSDKVTHDIPFSDGEDGWMEVTLKNISPIFVRNGHNISDNKENPEIYSSHVIKNGKRRYFIPGTSIKGMLRNVVEILSFGKMKQFNNYRYGYRVFDTRQSEGEKYKEIVCKAKIGWLELREEHYYLYEVDSYDRIDIATLCEQSAFAKLQDKDSNNHVIYSTPWKRNTITGEMYPYYDGKRLVCSGYIDKKEHEYLVPDSEKVSQMEVDENLIENFKLVYNDTPDFDKMLKALKQGKKLAVSYVKQGGKISYMGLPLNFKLPYKYSVADLIKRQQGVVDGRADLAETIFGYIDDKQIGQSLRGRVQIGNAFCISDDSVPLELNNVRGVHGQPKPSFYPFYLKQVKKENCYKTYESDDAQIAGRKMYRVHNDSSIMKISDGNGNENMLNTSEFIPLRSGLDFKFRINLHNIRPFELGALLSALTLHGNEGVFHNIGYSRAYGYGKMKIENIVLNGFKNNDIDNYLHLFEKEMSLMLRAAGKTNLTNSNQYIALMSIMSEHDNEDELKYLELKDYGLYRSDVFFKTLEEKEQTFRSYLDEDDRNWITDNYIQLANEMKLAKMKFDLAEEYVGLQASVSKEDIEKAEMHMKNISDEFARNNVKPDDLTLDEFEKVKQLRKKLEAEKEAAAQAAAQAEQQQKLERGLEGELSRKTPKGKFVINNLKTLNGNIVSWLRDAARETLTDDEKDVYEEHLRRVTSNKKERKPLLKKKEGKYWEEITSFIGEDRATALFKEINKK